MVKAEPFRIEIPEARLRDMQARLRATSWPDDPGNDTWHYGVNRDWLAGMVDYWANDFDWRRQEHAMNQLPQFRAVIDGQPIHFIHVRSERADAIPLILTHGWPWTFWDWKGVIDRLISPAPGLPAFDIVVPSLPGFGFSMPLARTGIDVREVAGLWVKLMRDVLGYDRFAAAGGDFGSMVTTELGHAHSDHVTAIHVTVPALPGMDFFAIADADYAPDEQWMVARNREARPLITSHLGVHTADPQTLAYALADSPVGTAAWIWERRRAWSDCNGDVIGHYGRDFLCTLASIYWLTNSIGSSLRLYKEHFSGGFPLLHQRQPSVPVPMGCALAPKELVLLPRQMIEQRANVQRWITLPRGGHFSPSEVPDLIAAEYQSFFAGVAAQP